MAAGGGLRVEGDRCPRGPLSAYLSTLPKDAVIAGDPVDMTCVPLVAQRPVVMSRKLYGVRHRDRMRDLVDAYYGGSVEAILRLRERYGAEHLVVRPDLLLARDLTGPWRRMEPFTSQRRRLMRSVPRPAALELPIKCRTYEGPRAHVVDLACVERELG